MRNPTHPVSFDILADYGRGYVRVASHSSLPPAIVQAEQRFIITTAISVQVRRSDQPTRVIQDSDGRALEWRL